MKQKVWIFGDSYSDKEYYYDHTSIPWTHEIEKYYDVSNFSKIGSSPDYEIKLLLNEINKYDSDELKSISVIFFISGIYRFNFKFFDIKDHALTVNFYDTGNEEVFLRYNEYKGFLKDFFKYYVFNSSYNDTELLKIVGMLKLLSNKFKKVLVWPIFDRLPLHVENSDNFYLVNKPLHHVSTDPRPRPLDTRNNHLSNKNNSVMLDELVLWMEKDWPINIKNFV